MMHRNRNLLAGSVAVILFVAALWGCRIFRGNSALPPAKKMIVLGIDGMDPQLLRQYMDEGKMPHFAALAKMGGFLPLGTSIPPQSPVAWSNLITGMNPGEHAIFDFIHRDPKTLVPYLSTSQVEPPKHTLSLGNWVFPLSSGSVTLLRQGKAFWEILDEHRVPTTVFRMPSNFPPVPSKGRAFAGMGTPDLLGTYGTFSFYTDDLLFASGPVNGGHIYSVSPEENRIAAKLYGPNNSFRKDSPQLSIDFTVVRDPVEPVAKITIQDQEILLRQGEWSDWVRVQFTFVPYLERVTGICKFYAKQLHPQFELYVTPLNLDPSNPALPLSTPESYSRELWEKVGFFYTQGIAEDTKALSSGLLNDEEYLQQARMVLREQRRIFDLELSRFRAGFLFFYFSSLDQNSHMFWRAIDKQHPAANEETSLKHSRVLEELYQEMDEALGKTLERLDENTTLLVMSDHGFAPYHRSFNLNTWLLDNGYIWLRPGAAREGADLFRDVDWSRTRAYGLGLNGLYLNLQGRERNGIVKPGPEADSLAAEIATRLLAVRDPAGNQPAITRVDKASVAYSGPSTSRAPDLIVGYNRGYRAGWGTVLGGFSAAIFEDNTEPWSGDHCMDFTLVPGVLLSNRQIVAASPALTDIAPTILSEFDVPKPKQMTGSSVFAKSP
ncbi:MAG: alkaline phosphatase family protein [Acidobacteria bacterium]|nr:alkaline phosphatase family protein [Acidobacteriota bacterium]